ncbi:hypothetical protein [Dysgonomonas macrotermitis]|uniref:Uncharacterized protein n=1 Tax=Dysgonomonas macrotermitis TaxID=1346286 RepID=A0A1M5C531_9BACT|nr:hypothetical protein [Dysgonomonas macrotermitis]SHF49815.1 hypothetical protein SAMN05444362_10733 [Dysgonomonas macrotermitis]
MKRPVVSKENEAKGINISLSDVVEVTFVKDTSFHKKGDKKYVSLPIASKLKAQGKVKIEGEAAAQVESLEKKIKEKK